MSATRDGGRLEGRRAAASPAATDDRGARAGDFRPRRTLRRTLGYLFVSACLAATTIGIVTLAVLLVDIWSDGAARVDWEFITSYPSRRPEAAGVLPAFVGSVWMLGLTALFSFPLGVATAIWLEEYSPDHWITRVIQVNIANLAGVPSIVYGILGLAVFVHVMALGRSLMAGALTLTLLILPVIIIAAQEAVRAVPNSIRLAAYALGATRWQTVRRQVLPMAMPGVLTGTILALSRAIGETAPLIVIGALAYVPFLPEGPMSAFTVLPIQIFNWVRLPQADFRHLAAAAILILLVVLLAFNLAAVLLRNRYTKSL